MKLNNKGFAITGILYTVFILFLLIIASVLAGLQLKRTMLEKSVMKLESIYEGTRLADEKVENMNQSGDLSNKTAPVTGKYIFNIQNNFFTENETSEYKYGEEVVQTFVPTKKGYYKLEVWGANGGDARTYKGGTGGYASGVIYIDPEEPNSIKELYIVIGGSGSSAQNNIAPGGRNGGGTSISSLSADVVGSGGGATHIIAAKGELTEEQKEELKKELKNISESNRSSVLIVAGGGGGAYHVVQSATAFAYSTGGAGGGIKAPVIKSPEGCGNVNGEQRVYTAGSPASQTEGGTFNRCGNPIGGESGSFGQGGGGNYSASYYWHSGGGGGYYGGGSGYATGAGGGSSYVASQDLINGTTISGNQALPKHNNMDNNGYAKITYYGEESIGVEYLYGSVEEAQEFKAIKEGQYKIELWGASGGGNSTNTGGSGGYTAGNIKLKTDEKLYVYVGEKGLSNEATSNAGAWNGGGYSGHYASAAYSYGGGGATDIRLEKASETVTEWNKIESLRSRIMVAGGGGGSAKSFEGYVVQPGVGGNLTGGTGTGSYNYVDAGGGKQTEPGIVDNIRAKKKGDFGSGPGPIPNNYGWGGGGGGGYYGGATGHGKGGGGGSSYISGFTGAIAVKSAVDTAPKCTEPTENPECSKHYSEKVFENPVMYSGESEMPSPTSSNNIIGNDNAGYAKITYYGNGSIRINDITCESYLKKGQAIDYNITFLTNDCNALKGKYKYIFDNSLTEDEYNVMVLGAIYSFEE